MENFRSKIDKESSRESKLSDLTKTWQEKSWWKHRVPITLRPIRLIQLILDTLLFAIAITFLIKPNNPMGTTASAILVILFASFAIAMCIDAVGQIGGCLTPDLPMFLITLLGFTLFTSAAQAVYLICYHSNNEQATYMLVLIALCLVAALLFLLDATIMIMYWRYTESRNDDCLPCLPNRSLNLLYHRSRTEEEIRPITRDISTSFSQERQRSFNSGFLGYRWSNNRVGVGLRREYVEDSTNPESKTSLKLVETQTEDIEPVERVDHETSAIPVVEEKNAQTLSQCPACSSSLEYSPEGICPTFLALVQSFGMFSCPQNLQIKSGAPVLVDRGTLPGSNSSLKVKESTIIVSKKAPRVYETRACPTHGAGLIAQKAGLPNPVTRISLTHSIRKNKGIQTPTSKPIAISDKYQNTEVNVVEETTNTEGSSLVTIGGSAIELKEELAVNEEFLSPEVQSISEEIRDSLNYEKSTSETDGIAKIGDDGTDADSSSGNFQASSQDPDGLQKIEGSSPILKDSFNSQISSERFDVFPVQDNSRVFGKKIKSENGSPLIKNEKLSPKVLPSDTKVNRRNSNYRNNIFRISNKVESMTLTSGPIRKASSTFAEISSTLESAIGSAKIGKYLNESRELRSLSLQLPKCKCSQLLQYYYKDVFGRYICGLCAHKYLIKMPQRYTAIKPVVGDVRCCSCSQSIFYQAPQTTQTRFQNCCRCRYQMYASSSKK